MSHRWFAGILCLALVGGAAWFGRRGEQPQPAAGWVEVAPGLLRSAQLPAGYALLDGDRALLIDAPRSPDGLAAHGVKKVELVLLTHHHRDTCAAAPVAKFLADAVPVRAAKAAAEWLTPEGVRKYWQESLPLRNSRTAYLVLPVGLKGIDCSLDDGQTITWRGWTVKVVATPGHSRDHLAFALRKQAGDPWLVCCGDALAGPSKLWSPYTTDWDHWTDAGLVPTAQSLRQLADLKPALLLPAHGPVIDKNPVAALTKTAVAVEEVAFLKSFERYTKQRLGNAPQYQFLAKEQAGSNGAKPWTRVSPSLWLTGNTYVLVSKEQKAFLVVDPWAKRSADQVLKLQKDQQLGPLEVVMFSHAHYDHYDGVYDLPGRDRFEIWALDRVAGPIAEPYRLRAPFLDARPVKFDRTPKAGDTLTWREYRFRFHHLPGQSEFTSGVETVIDGKRCYFTADNWFHQDQYSGSGGWMGLNRSWPLSYAASAQKVLDARPDWVLAEHGGPFEFDAEDFRRRVQWGKVSATAADAVCVSGNHLKDWNPHRVHAEPLVQKAKAGATLDWALVVENPMKVKERVTVTLEGRGLMKDQSWNVDVGAEATARRAFSFQVPANLGVGRHVFILRSAVGNQPDVADAFAVVDVGP